MEEKRIDNEMINIKQKINELDNKIDDEKNRIKRLDEMQEEITSLNKNIDKCIELLSVSLQGPTTQNKFKDMYDSNKSLYVNMTSSIDEEIDMTRSRVNKLYEEKDNIIKENKNQKE